MDVVQVCALRMVHGQAHKNGKTGEANPRVADLEKRVLIEKISPEPELEPTGSACVADSGGMALQACACGCGALAFLHLLPQQMPKDRPARPSPRRQVLHGPSDFELYWESVTLIETTTSKSILTPT